MMMCVFFMDHADFEKSDPGAVPAIQVIHGFSVCGKHEHVEAVRRYSSWPEALNYVQQKRAKKESLQRHPSTGRYAKP